MKASEMAWAAGLFEGEGSLSVMQKASGRPAIQLSLTSTDQDVLGRFVEIVGIGRIYGPYRQDRLDWKPQWNWRAHGWDALQKLRDVWDPWLGSRRRNRFDEVLALRPAPYVRIARNRKLSDDQVREVRARLRRGERQSSIAADVELSQSEISKIKLGKSYREVR